MPIPADVSNRIDNCRAATEELNEFFRKVDARIAADPEDPREGIGMLPGLERVLLLTPCILDRLESDIRVGRIAFDFRMIGSVAGGIGILSDSLKAVRVYYDLDDRARASELMERSYRRAMKNLKEPRDRHPGRFFKDMGRLARDFHGLAVMFRRFEENRKREPMPPEGEREGSVDAWFEYYVEKARREDPLFDCVEAGGMTEQCLREGYRRTIEQSKELDRDTAQVMRSYRWYESRDEAFDPEHPAAFLDAERIPLKEDRAEVIEPGEDARCDLESGDESDFRDDPVYRILDPLSMDLMRACRMDEPPGDMENPDLPQVLRNYVVLLALKPRARIASCHVWVEQTESDAPRQAVYRFAAHCLKRIAESIEKFGGKDLLPCAAKARRARRAIEKNL